MYKALTIAGSDSGAGAGIQADLKTFAARGVYGTSAITAITAQNTLGVTAVVELSPEIIGAQIDAILSDIGADAAKTGMLSSVPIIELVVAKLQEWKIERLVVDPVMVAKSGDRLLREDAVQALKSRLLPLALIATPNLAEAAVLAGHPVHTRAEMERAAQAIAAMGPRYVVVKGGQGEGTVFDLLFDGNSFTEYASNRIQTNNTQGTGCTFSAAIAAELARGNAVPGATESAKLYVTAAMTTAPNIGGGHGPLNHFPRY